MATNQSSIDRAARVLLGLVLLALVFVGPKTSFGFVGLILIITGVWGFCPLYRAFGIHTGGPSHPAST
jgi:hypothetical protein